MADTTAANGKEAAYFGVPWEDAYGYAQAIKVGDTIYVSGQLSHDDKGTMIAPAALDESGKPADFSTMGEQMRVTYANAAVVFVISYLLLYSRPGYPSHLSIMGFCGADESGAACFRAVVGRQPMLASRRQARRRRCDR